MSSMPAPAFALASSAHQEVVDFLRRLSSMLTGGRNAEMLQEAANMIETLSRRTAGAEHLLQEQQEEHARNLELREVAELASDNLMSEIASLKAQFGAEIAALTEKLEQAWTELDETRQRAETDRNWFAEETLRAQAAAELAQEHLAVRNAELEELRKPPPPETLDDSIAVVPAKSLHVARSQFNYLAEGFAAKGDLVSQTICQIGASALEQALAGSHPAKGK
jgi:hypothetical protein